MRSPLILSIAVILASASASAKPALVFSLAQGFSNDPVGVAGSPQADAALLRTIQVLKAFRLGGYDAYALINPQYGNDPNKTNLNHVLRKLRDNGVPFVLDVISSDTFFLGPASPNSPVSRDTGMAIWPSGGGWSPYSIQYYRDNYPSTFKGIRIHEPEWIFDRYQRIGWSLNEAYGWIRKFVQYAAGNGLWVMYTSTMWDGTCRYCAPNDPKNPSLAAMALVRSTAQVLSRDFPNVLYPTYANNDGTYTRRLDPAQGLPTWKSLVSFPGMRGLGLSDQSWMTGMPGLVGEMNAPYAAINQFVDNANSTVGGPVASILEFEPYWYFFTWDGSVGPTNGNLTNNGATSNGVAVAANLGAQCWVRIWGTCAKVPSYSNYAGLDHFAMGAPYFSGIRSDVCNQRAADYFTWCGGSAAVTTTYSLTGATTTRY